MTVLAVIAFGLAQIGNLVNGPIADAAKTLSAVAGIWDQLNKVQTGAVSPVDAKTGIDSIMAALASNDAAADTALDEKFKET